MGLFSGRGGGKATLVPEAYFLILSSSELDRSNAPEFSLASRCRRFAAQIRLRKRRKKTSGPRVGEGLFSGGKGGGGKAYFWTEFCVSKMFGLTFGSDFASGNFKCIHCIVNSLNITI